MGDHGRPYAKFKSLTGIFDDSMTLIWTRMNKFMHKKLLSLIVSGSIILTSIPLSARNVSLLTPPSVQETVQNSLLDASAPHQQSHTIGLTVKGLITGLMGVIFFGAGEARAKNHPAGSF